MKCCHPFLSTQPSLSCKVMEMGDQALKNICQTRIIALRIDAHSVFGDIVDCQILHRRYIHLGGVHLDSIKFDYFQICSLSILNILSSTWYQGYGSGRRRSANSGAGREDFIMSWLRDFPPQWNGSVVAFSVRRGISNRNEPILCGYARGVVMTEDRSAGEGSIIGVTE